MKTRKQYMNKECSHREYYAQFVTPAVKRLVVSRIGIERLKASQDEHLNDIPLSLWDAVASQNKSLLAIGPEYGEWGNDPRRLWNLSTAVCTLKEAARQLIEEAAERVHWLNGGKEH